MARPTASRWRMLWTWLQKNGLSIAAHISAIFFILRLIWLLASGSFFIDPVRQTTTLTGKLAITYLLLSLGCTPVNILFGWSQVMRARRPLGLYAFGFALLHGLTYVGWDYQFDLPLLFQSLLYQRYVLVGGGAFLILALLAITSIHSIRKRMGKGWVRFQRLVYVAGALAVGHILWLRKSPREVLPLLMILAVLFILRVPWIKTAIIKLRKSLTKRGGKI